MSINLFKCLPPGIASNDSQCKRLNTDEEMKILIITYPNISRLLDKYYWNSKQIICTSWEFYTHLWDKRVFAKILYCKCIMVVSLLFS